MDFSTYVWPILIIVLCIIIVILVIYFYKNKSNVAPSSLPINEDEVTDEENNTTVETDEIYNNSE